MKNNFFSRGIQAGTEGRRSIGELFVRLIPPEVVSESGTGRERSVLWHFGGWVSVGEKLLLKQKLTVSDLGKDIILALSRSFVSERLGFY